MGVFEHFPYTNFHDLNLDWMIDLCKNVSAEVNGLDQWKISHEQDYEILKNKVDGIISNLTEIINPWDSSIAYHIFTIVEYMGDNYIAIQDVPVGAMITDTTYWQLANTTVDQINAMSVIVSGLRKNIIYTDIQDITDATSVTEDTLVVVNGGDITLTGEVFPDFVDFYFVNGILSGDCEIHGNIMAGRKQIFDPAINLTVEKQKTGYPEWFGGDDVGIQKCYDTFTITDLDAVDYEINTTLVFDKSHKKIVGKVYNSEYASNTAEQGTRLRCNFNDAPCVLIGSGTSSPSVTQIWMQDISIACVTPDYTNTASTGIEIHGMRACNLHNILVSNFRNGFTWLYIVLCQASYCRFICNKTTGTDTVIGFRLTDEAQSLYITHCDVTFVNAGQDNTIGIYANVPTGLMDFWVTDSLLTRCYYGVQLIGASGVDRQQDIFICNNVIDNCAEAIRVSQKIKAIITDNWLSVGNFGTTTRCIHLVSLTGGASITGNHLKSSDAATSSSSYGIRYETANNVISSGNIVHNFSNPFYATNSNNIGIDDEIINSNVTRTTNAAVFEGTKFVTVDVGINGDYKYANGVQVTGSCENVCINPTRINPAAITTNKVLIAGVAQTNSNTFQVLTNNNCIIGTI